MSGSVSRIKKDLAIGLNYVMQVIGNSSDPTAATTKQFQEFWHELASRFSRNPNVIFGINNEPHDMVCGVSFTVN